MRLFGTPGGSLDAARSTYQFLVPFDLALASPEQVIEWIDKGGYLLDHTGQMAWGVASVGYAYFAFIPSPAIFNARVDGAGEVIIADGNAGIVGVDAVPAGATISCDC